MDFSLTLTQDAQLIDGLNAAVVTSAAPDPGSLPFSPATSTALLKEATRRGFEPKAGQVVSLMDADGRACALLGMSPDKRDVNEARQVGVALHKCAEALQLPAARLWGLDQPSVVQSLTEGTLLSVWRFDRYKKSPTEKQLALRYGALELVASEDLQGALDHGRHLAEAVCLARDLANEPPNVCTPLWLANRARELGSRHGFETTILELPELRERGFNLLEAVGRGSDHPPLLIHLVYRPEGEILRRVALVGKGLTFDAGGYSLKPADSQIDMHLDMGGAVATLGCADAIGRIRPDGVEVHFLVPAAENLISGGAYKVMDIIKGYGGVSVEVLNTDAEGRLVLADALAYATKDLGVDTVIDLATLTGSCVVALGQETAGLFASDDALAAALLKAADESGEALWRLPLVQRIEAQLDSWRADVRNIGSRWGGAISAALFLKRFVGETPWAHIDLAGPAMADKAWHYIPAGGTGFGVLLMTRYLQDLAAATPAAGRDQQT